MDSKENRYVHFRLGLKEFLIDISLMDEVIDLEEIVEIPDVPPFIAGVTRFRTQVIPVINTKIKLDMQDTSYNDRAKIMIIKHEKGIFGMVIDKLIGVKDFSPDQLGRIGMPDILAIDKLI